MTEPGTSAVNDDLSAKLADMTTVQLKQELRKRKLKTAGLKGELVLRLLPFMQLEREHSETEQYDDIKNKNDEGVSRKQESSRESDISSSDEDEEPIAERRRNMTGRARENQLLTFKDVEESLDTFNGDDKVDVKG
ncbi:sap domain containing [Lasius niger]|uniref:Sap domain containing n=1 Tax=Lasius niger TaxID=67767 RepID=A0A0J7K715_LASNI|nr:sap domain containing [Lasius niger]